MNPRSVPAIVVPVFFLAVFACCLLAGPVNAARLDTSKLPGNLVDDEDAVTKGKWRKSHITAGYVGVGYQVSESPESTMTFPMQVAATGEYHVLIAYTSGPNREKAVPVAIHTAAGIVNVTLNEKSRAQGPFNFQPVGKFKFEQGESNVVISSAGATDYIITDAVWLLNDKQLAEVKKLHKATPALLTSKPAPAGKGKSAKPVEPQPEPPAFVKAVFPELPRLTAARIDELIEESTAPLTDDRLIGDEQFLRRVTLDLVGRQPTVEEHRLFMADKSKDRRKTTVERLLANPQFGGNWADYWSDVIGSRQQEPELTFHDYRPFKGWLAGQLNENRNWDEITFRMLTSAGKVGKNPEATFVAFHQGNPQRLAGETSRVFLGVQIHCAECHDHPFVDLPQQTFHGMAAFFTRTSVKIAQFDSGLIELKSKTKGEHRIEGKGKEIVPVSMSMTDDDRPATAKLGTADLDRRAELAKWLSSPTNPYFSRSYVNRMWARTMGRGFIDPVDNMGEGSETVLPELFHALADHFTTTGYDVKEVFRLIMSTRAYRLKPGETTREQPFLAAPNQKLRGDEVFASLQASIGLPDVTPPRLKKTAAVRFPPPPKSTRDLVNQAFGYDPSFRQKDVTRTMKQAMFMMNNDQLQKQIDASPASKSYLSQILQNHKDDRQAITSLYEAVLARRPTTAETTLCIKHLQAGAADAKSKSNRGELFEDLLWSLLNSTEFTTRR